MMCSIAAFSAARRSSVGDLTALAPGARLFQSGGAQQAADVVGAKRRSVSGHNRSPGRVEGQSGIVFGKVGGGGARAWSPARVRPVGGGSRIRRRLRSGAAWRSSTRKSAARATRGAGRFRSIAPAVPWRRTRYQPADRVRENAHVGGGEVESFGAGRRHDVRGIAGQEQASVLHRLRDEAAHRGDALLNDRAFIQAEAVAVSKRRCNSSQMRSSGQRARSSSGRHCRYTRLICGVRMLSSAKPRS